MNLTIYAETRDGLIIPPRTKKNHPVIVRGLKRPVLLPSPEYREWESAALKTFVRNGYARRIVERVDGSETVRHVWLGEDIIAGPANCRALIYREKLTGDAVGYYQAIGDFLQKLGAVENDKWLQSWDGSRLLKDAARPRVEVEITLIGPAPAVQGEIFAGVMG